ncbi:hypothetical protein DPMN_150009 [Dreissena polymorpha]|uniref:Uncharacterized protein n=1 Tax=Dreissena polymorpha TaxID=45954 RepID=A0A9D4FEL1_DREPO|nr:hypothetical protein DPMN_150009 [Dreissena polymorpha]
MADDACNKLRGTYLSIVNSGISPLALNPSTSIKVYNSVVTLKALYGCELWTSISAEDIIKLERSHRFCLKHIQGLPRNTATNFTLCAIHAVPMETIVDYRKLVFLGQLCNLPNTYMAKHLFNSRLLYYENFDKQHHGFIPDIRALLCKYELHHILDQYIAEGLFPVKSVWKTMLRRHVTQKKECKSVSRVFREVPLSWLINITV